MKFLYARIFTFVSLTSTFLSVSGLVSVKTCPDVSRIGRLRYKIYEHEAIHSPDGEPIFKEIYEHESDHEHKMLVEEVDRTGVHFVVDNESTGNLDGCLRLHYDNIRESMGKYADYFYNDDMEGKQAVYASRMGVSPDARGTMTMIRLCSHAVYHMRHQSAEQVYLITTDKLSLLYKRLGFVVLKKQHGMNLLRLDLTQDHGWVRAEQSVPLPLKNTMVDRAQQNPVPRQPRWTLPNTRRPAFQIAAQKTIHN